MQRDALRREALRVNHRYMTEVVEALGLCPWAQAARQRGRVRRAVLFGAEPDPVPALVEIAAMAADPEVEVGLLLFPELTVDRYRFRRFTSDLRERDAARYPPGETPLAMAPFHPHAEPDMRTPARLVSAIRRTPDPTIQLVRRSALAHVRRAERGAGTIYAGPEVTTPADWAPEPGPALHERIAEANHATIERLGVASLTALLDDIRADRDRSYAALRVAPPPQ